MKKMSVALFFFSCKQTMKKNISLEKIMLNTTLLFHCAHVTLPIYYAKVCKKKKATHYSTRINTKIESHMHLENFK